MAIDFYTNLHLQRQNWIPVKIPNESLKTYNHKVPEVIERVIALSLHLEMPVGAWIGEVTRKTLNLPKSAIALLKSNIADETKHQRQFELAAAAYPVRAFIMQEAQAIAQNWMQHPDSVLTKAKELEVGVFLPSQAMIRFYGGQALDRMASDISLDEWRHVQTNCSVCEELGLVSSPSLSRLRVDTLDWLVQGLTFPKVDSSFWLRQSSEMVENYEAPEMEALFNWAPMLSFFEISNSHLSAYG